ncbi:MAG: biopolymer transporter ExbD [Planctomycetales bacterium]
MPLKTQIDEQPTLNLTPMIDIVFLLIIFFMVGTKFSELERKIGLEPPSVSDNGTLTSAPASKIVNVFRDGRIELDNQTVSLKQLTQMLAAAHGQYPAINVLVRGDAEGRFQPVASVLNACSQAGVSRMSVSVKLTDRSAGRERIQR